MSENKITFPVKLASNNPQSFGIVDAIEVSGHKSVDTLSDLYAISDPVLSVLKDGSDAIGQEWFVVSEDCKYRLDNWANRKSVAGWTKLPKQELINTKQSVSEKDQPDGYAGLDSNGKIPIEKTYGDTATVTEVETYESLPVTGLSGVIYYVSNTGMQYKWSGSSYVDITDGADNAKKNETSIFDCSNGTSTKYYSNLSEAINVVPPVYRTSNRIISYLSTENATTSAVNYQYHGIDSTTWSDLTKWERVPNQADLAELRSDLSETNAKVIGLKASGGVLFNKRFNPNMNQSEIINADGYCITGFIPVDSSQLVYIYANNNSVWNVYNTNKEYLGTESSSGGVTAKNLSTYTDAAYVRGCVVTDSFNNMWLKNNDTYIIFDNTIAGKIYDVNSDIATLTQLTQREYTDILSEGGFEFYKAQQSDGTVIDSGYQCISPYIDVSSNRSVKVYLGGNAGLYCGYDQNKKFVDYYNIYSTPTARNLPSTVYYIRLNMRLTDVNNAYVAYNDETDRKMWVSVITWSKRVTDLESGFKNLSGRVNDVYPLLESGEYSYHKRIDGANIYNDRPFIVSPYIDIRNNRNLEIFPNGNRTMYVQGYDQNKNYIDYWSIASGKTMTRVLLNTIYYIRVCYNINRQDGVFVKNHLNGDVIWKPFLYWQDALESGDVIAMHPHKKVYSLLANLKNNIDPMTIRPYGDENLSLLFFSDLHACATPLERIGKFAEEYCIDNNIKYIDAVVVGGDNVNRATDNYDFWGQCGASSFLPVIGNHELLIPEDKVSAGTYQIPQVNGINVALNSMPYSAKFVYEREFAPFLSATNFTSIVEGKCYWYKDFANAKIRLIGIDDYHWKESPIRLVNDTFANEYPDGETLDNGEQLAWFENTLASSKSLGYSVIVVHHSPARFDSTIQCSFTSLDFQNNIATDPISPSGAPYTKEPFEAVQAFIDGGGKFICWLTGHLHQDAVGVIKGFTDQFQMTIDTARYGYDSEGRSLGNGFGHNAHISDTTSADCMDIVSVDTYHKQLSLVRIGSDYDRRGRHIGTFVWDYEHKQMISSD